MRTDAQIMRNANEQKRTTDDRKATRVVVVGLGVV